MSSIFPENSGQFKPRFDTPPVAKATRAVLATRLSPPLRYYMSACPRFMTHGRISARIFFANEKTAFPPPERRAYALAFTHASAFALVSAARLSPSCLELAPPLA